MIPRTEQEYTYSENFQDPVSMIGKEQGVMFVPHYCQPGNGGSCLLDGASGVILTCRVLPTYGILRKFEFQPGFSAIILHQAIVS
jgi:hypothetical protein